MTTHSGTWLQLTAPVVAPATNYLRANGVEACDELDELPGNMHWIHDPAGTVFNFNNVRKNNHVI